MRAVGKFQCSVCERVEPIFATAYAHDDLFYIFEHSTKFYSSAPLNSYSRSELYVGVSFPYASKQCINARAVIIDIVKGFGMEPKSLSMITLGCDPEFAAYSGYDRMYFNKLLPQAGALGYDHSGRVAELRPAPARSALTLVSRIRKLLNDAPEAMRAWRWKAGGIAINPTDALGGHIHIGVNLAAQGAYSLVEALDEYTRVLTKLDILPAAEQARRQKETGYGKYGNLRNCRHGEIDCIEYRVMPSWLYDPKVAMLALAGARFVASDWRVASASLIARSASYAQLRTFFEMFTSKSLDARFILEKVLDTEIKADPDAEMQRAWELD